MTETKVRYINPEKREFGELQGGDFFSYGNELFMKATPAQAWVFGRGELILFDSCVEVRPLKEVEIRVKEWA